MKLVSKGFINKFVDDIKRGKHATDMDNLHLSMNTKHNPFKRPIELKAENPFNNADLFMVTFEKLCKK